MDRCKEARRVLLEEVEKILWDLADDFADNLEYEWRCLLLAAWNLVCAVKDRGLRYALEKIHNARRYLSIAESVIEQEIEKLEELAEEELEKSKRREEL